MLKLGEEFKEAIINGVLEKGGNSSSTTATFYEKYTDGRLEIWGYRHITIESEDLDTFAYRTIVFPVAFRDSDYIVTTDVSSPLIGTRILGTASTNRESTSVDIGIRRTGTTGTNRVYFYIKGFWK
jgi:hypothetical protein